MATTFVFERRPPLSRSTPSGNEYVREFSIQAPSYSDALARLDMEQEVREGVVYRDASGITDPSAIVLGIGGVPTTPLASGAEGEWLVTVQYGPASNGMTRFLPLIVNGPARKWIESTETSEPADTFLSGSPIVNGAGEPIEPPVILRRRQRSLFVEFQRTFANELAASVWADQWSGRVNSAVYFGAGVRCLYCAEMSYAPTNVKSQDNQPVFLMRGRFDFRDARSIVNNGVSQVVPGWDLLKLNLGRRMKWIHNNQLLIEIRAELPPSTANNETNVNPYDDTLPAVAKRWRNSELLRSPVMLFPDGTYWRGPIPTNYITGQLYPSTDFNGLGI